MTPPTNNPGEGNPAAERPDQPLDSFLADAGLAFDDIPVAMAIHRRALLHERRATKVYAVVYGNYSPSEIVAIWRTREDAEADAASREGPWEVEEWPVLDATASEEEARHG